MKQSPSTGYVFGGGEGMAQGQDAPPVILQDQQKVLEFIEEQAKQSLERKRQFASTDDFLVECWGNDGGHDVLH